MSESAEKASFLREKRLALTSSTLFLAGSTVLAVLVTSDRIKPLRSLPYVKGTLLVIIAYALLALHVVPEIALDRSTPQRPFSHNRYGKLQRRSRRLRVDFAYLNFAQSFTFFTASLVQGAAFFVLFEYEDNEDFDNVDIYCKINLASSSLWVITSALALVSRGCCWIRYCRSWTDTLEQSGNGLYIVSTFVWMIAGLNQFENFDHPYLGDNLQDCVLIIWFVVGCLYTAADVRRFYERRTMHVDSRPFTKDNHDDDKTEYDDEEDDDNATDPGLSRSWTSTSYDKDTKIKWGPDADATSNGETDEEKGNEVFRI